MKISSSILRKLREIAEREKILFGYFFGSEAKRKSGKLSDLDFGFYFEENLNPKERFERKLRLITELSDLFKKEVDIVILNEVERIAALAYRAISEGKILFSFNEKKGLLLRLEQCSFISISSLI